MTERYPQDKSVTRVAMCQRTAIWHGNLPLHRRADAKPLAESQRHPIHVPSFVSGTLLFTLPLRGLSRL